MRDCTARPIPDMRLAPICRAMRPAVPALLEVELPAPSALPPLAPVPPCEPELPLVEPPPLAEVSADPVYHHLLQRHLRHPLHRMTRWMSQIERRWALHPQTHRQKMTQTNRHPKRSLSASMMRGPASRSSFFLARSFRLAVSAMSTFDRHEILI